MPSFLHTSIFVNDMNESIAFYTEKLGLKLLDGPFHYPGNADMAFVGANWNSYIELVFDLEDHPPYALGNRYEHLAIESDGALEPYIATLKRASKYSKTSTNRPEERVRLRSSKIRTAFPWKCSNRAGVNYR